MTDTTTTRIDDPALWRAGDVLTVLDADGKEILRAVLEACDDSPWLGLPNGTTVRYAWSASEPFWLTADGRTYTVSREVPAVPTEPNTLLMDVETRNGRTYPLVRVGPGARLEAYSGSGRFDHMLDRAVVVAWTPVVPGERVTR